MALVEFQKIFNQFQMLIACQKYSIFQLISL